jgi:hypothetical protein
MSEAELHSPANGERTRQGMLREIRDLAMSLLELERLWHRGSERTYMRVAALAVALAPEYADVIRMATTEDVA